MIKLQMTCGACPEQYDAFLDGRQVGYLRLRHSTFRVDCPDCGGETVFSTDEVEGDGVFVEHERQAFLDIAVQKIEQWLVNHSET